MEPCFPNHNKIYNIIKFPSGNKVVTAATATSPKMINSTLQLGGEKNRGGGLNLKLKGNKTLKLHKLVALGHCEYNLPESICLFVSDFKCSEVMDYMSKKESKSKNIVLFFLFLFFFFVFPFFRCN